jgi:N-acetylglucosaminyldiphosphoundecaprenol N-acetyl-beta-D-mannosaminyltransferase
MPVGSGAETGGRMIADRFTVEGVPVDMLSYPEACAAICNSVGQDHSATVFTLNLDHVVKLRRDAAFRAAYDRAAIVLADGAPIALAGCLQGKPVTRTTGADIVDPLCAHASRRGLSVFFYGSTTRSLDGAARILAQRHPGLRIAGALAPPDQFDVRSNAADRDIETIRASGADICFVALGAPKQELFADRCRTATRGMAFVCIGAALDFISGHQVRAPAVVQQVGLEWLWRLARAPRRMSKRYFDCATILPGVMLSSAKVAIRRRAAMQKRADHPT